MINSERNTIEMAIVGPETRCNDKPNSATMIGVTIEVYSLYPGSNPAIVANATLWGRTITELVNPEIRSALRKALLTSLEKKKT